MLRRVLFWESSIYTEKFDFSTEDQVSFSSTLKTSAADQTRFEHADSISIDLRNYVGGTGLILLSLLTKEEKISQFITHWREGCGWKCKRITFELNTFGNCSKLFTFCESSRIILEEQRPWSAQGDFNFPNGTFTFWWSMFLCSFWDTRQQIHGDLDGPVKADNYVEAWTAVRISVQNC